MTFDRVVSHSELDQAFTLMNRSTRVSIEDVVVTPENIAGKTVAVWTFSGTSEGNSLFAGVLESGNYELAINPNRIRIHGQFVPVYEADETFSFTAQAGDLDGDGVVNLWDFQSLKFAIQQSAFDAELDLVRDGDVDEDDLATLLEGN